MAWFQKFHRLGREDVCYDIEEDLVRLYNGLIFDPLARVELDGRNEITQAADGR